MAILGKKWFVGGAAALAVLFMIWLGYRHYNKLQDELGALREAQGQLSAALDLERQSVRELEGVADDWAQSREALEKALEEMQEEAHVAREESRQLRKLFAEIDLGAMAPAAAGALADSLSDRLWGNLQGATDRGGSGRGAGPAGEGPPADAGAGAPDGDQLGGAGDRARDRPVP